MSAETESRATDENSTRFNRRQFLKKATAATIVLSAGSLSAGLLAGCGQESATAKSAPVETPKTSASETVKIGYLPITDATPLLIAHAKGLFQEEGLQVEKPTLVRSWSQLSEAFMARTFNLAHLLFPIPIYMRYNLKYPVKVVAWNHLNGSAVTVGEKSGIRGYGDLGGKQIAVPHWYSQHNILLQRALRTLGLEPVIQDRKAPLTSNQTNLFVLSPPDMPTALQTGAIDGYTVAEPFNAAGEVLAGGRILRFNGDVWRNHPCCVAVLHEEVIKQNQPWAQKVLNALVKSERWCVDNKEEAAQILSKDGQGYLPFEKKVIVRAMTKYDLETYGSVNGSGAIQHPEWQAKRIGFQPYPYRSATIRMTEMLKETKVEGNTDFLKDLDPQKVADDLIDYDLVKKAVDKIGGLVGFDGVISSSPYERQEEIAV